MPKLRPDTEDSYNEKTILALLEQPTMKQAAKVLGISQNALIIRMDKPGFREKYREARRKQFDQSIARLVHSSGPAVTTLFELMMNKEVPYGVRRQCASDIITNSRQSIELDDINERVKALELAAGITAPPK